MPKRKDLKRLVRTRMQKTGESYTAARAQLLRKPAHAQPTPDFARLAGMSDDAISAATGRTWAQWTRVLDAIDAHTLPHREIAVRVRRDFGVPGWWCQAVTVGYERIRGLRAIGQRRDGTYEANKSRTFPVPVATLHRAFADARVRSKWLQGVPVRVRKSTPSRSVRMTWPDGAPVEAMFVDKGVESQVAIQHRKVASQEEAARLKAWWAERLDALAEVLSK